MSWLIAYWVGFAVTMMLVSACAAQEGKEKEEFGAIIVSSILWPFAVLYAIGVTWGRALKKAQVKK